LKIDPHGRPVQADRRISLKIVPRWQVRIVARAVKRSTSRLQMVMNTPVGLHLR